MWDWGRRSATLTFSHFGLAGEGGVTVWASHSQHEKLYLLKKKKKRKDLFSPVFADVLASANTGPRATAAPL